jgi:hypothetical protein
MVNTNNTTDTHATLPPAHTPIHASGHQPHYPGTTSRLSIQPLLPYIQHGVLKSN